MKWRGKMKCAWHKWNISRALDSGEPLNSLTQQHLARCEACRKFSRLAEEMGRRLTEDAGSLLRQERPALNQRAKRAPEALGTNASTSLLARPRLLRPRIALATAVVLAVVGVSLFWMARSRPAGMPRLGSLLQTERGLAGLVSTLQTAESPYQEEISELKKTLKSTSDYLASRFVTSLGENNE
jgi:predicted anti-sigma-YlaC factor YlaD